MSGEFELIARHWQRNRPLHHAQLGIGDDCALLQPLAGEQLAISTDTLIANRHFFDDVDAHTLGHKALAVNLSDLAACGAQPLAFTLALSIEHANDAWLQKLSAGMFALADAYQCDLVGGDTTRGALSICITVFGTVPPAQFIHRHTAQVGDDIYISHPNQPQHGIGDARLALHLLQINKKLHDYAELAHCNPSQRHSLLAAIRQRLEQPQPRIALGLALRGVASAALDVSDGIAGDIQHLLNHAQLGATLYATHPDGSGLQAALGSHVQQCLTPATALHYALQGGDDYELLFTAAPNQHAPIADIARQCQLQCTRIGTIEAQTGLRWQGTNTPLQPLQAAGFDHFAV